MNQKNVSVNPYTGEELDVHVHHSEGEVEERLRLAKKAQKNWRKKTTAQRAEYLPHLARVLRENKKHFAVMITSEMGKPITEAEAEIEKCAVLCMHYAGHAEDYLRPETFESDAHKTYVRCDPLGTVLGIMPWNFPFWQAFRFGVPAITAGNATLLKHAPNVCGCAGMIENAFAEAGYERGIFQEIRIDHERAARLIAHEQIKGIALTGSDRAGAAVASNAGSHIKPTVLELGGSNAFAVFPDAPLDKAVKIGVKARFMNSGQSCIAAKRFLVHEDIAGEFIDRFVKAVRDLRSGDPIERHTQIGPLARTDLAKKLGDQVKKSVQAGAKLILGGNRKKCFYEPTVLMDVEPGMPAFDEELFGPVAPFTTFSTDAEALKLINRSSFGLGASLITSDTDKAEKMAAEINDGAVFINALVKSDPRLPFGGTGRSGYGRELSREGIREFVNIKTVSVDKI